MSTEHCFLYLVLEEQEWLNSTSVLIGKGVLISQKSSSSYIWDILHEYLTIKENVFADLSTFASVQTELLVFDCLSKQDLWLICDKDRLLSMETCCPGSLQEDWGLIYPVPLNSISL
jgi:hypothetical protein